jgi:hypothetical protein
MKLLPPYKRLLLFLPGLLSLAGGGFKGKSQGQQGKTKAKNKSKKGELKRAEERAKEGSHQRYIHEFYKEEIINEYI